MILIVCPNLAVDVTLEIEGLERGGVHRTRGARRQPGGKGVNVARALKALGERPVVVGFAGGRAGEAIAEGLAREAIEADLVPIPGESRSCTILLEPDGIATVVNEEGPRVDDASALFSRFQARLEGEETVAVALMGSLPPGLPLETYSEMVRLAHERARVCLVDTSGGALQRALGAGPDFAKPNRAEAEALVGHPLDSESSRIAALNQLRRMGAVTALITFGEEGFLLAGADGLFARCSLEPPADPTLSNPTGAGDSLAAGLLAGRARGYDLRDCARLGGAAAAASLAEGYGRFRPRDVRVDRVRFEVIEAPAN